MKTPRAGQAPGGPDAREAAHTSMTSFTHWESAPYFTRVSVKDFTEEEFDGLARMKRRWQLGEVERDVQL